MGCVSSVYLLFGGGEPAQSDDTARLAVSTLLPVLVLS